MRNPDQDPDAVTDRSARVLSGPVLQLLHDGKRVIHDRILRDAVDLDDRSDAAGIMLSQQ